MAEVELIATSTMGLEAVVARELEDLGYQAEVVETGRVLFRGDYRAICRANLWLRAAGRVLVRLGEFEATDFGQLFDRTYALPWEAWIPPDGAFPVNGRSHKSQLSSVPACQKIVKKAVANKLLAAHRVTHLDETGPHVHARSDAAQGPGHTHARHERAAACTGAATGDWSARPPCARLWPPAWCC